MRILPRLLRSSLTPVKVSERQLARPYSSSAQMTRSNMGPSYGLNHHLDVNTPEPPVPMAKAWAAAYPCSKSPLVPPANDNQGAPVPLQPLLNLAQGVPGHAPHKSLLKAMDNERNKQPMETHGYGGVFGDESLREALAADLCRVYSKSQSSSSKAFVQPQNIAITAGCNLAAAVVFHALAAPGEAIVVPTPWYFNHQMTLASLAVEPVPLPTSTSTFLPQPADLQELLKERNSNKSDSKGHIKGIVLVTPNNPTGAIYSPQLLAELAGICRQWNVACIVDETYRDFLLKDCESSASKSEQPALACPHDLFADESHDWQDCVISLHSFSKSYAIPGHRLGAIVAHPSLLITQTRNAQTGSLKNHFGSLAKSLDNMQICPPRTDTQRAVASCISDNEHRAWRLGVAADLLLRQETFASNLANKITLDEALGKLELTGQHKTDVKALCDAGNGNESMSHSPKDLGWSLKSAGGYYAYVQHPFDKVSSEIIARGLALLCGVVVLPGSFFQPADAAKLDGEIRFSIANVESARMETLGPRLVLLTRLWMAQGVGWGI